MSNVESAQSGVDRGNGPAPVAVRRDWLPTAIIVATVFLVAAAIVVTPGFLTIDNARAILRNAAIVGIVAVAMTPITLSGNFVSLGISDSAMLSMVSFVALLGVGVPQLVAIAIVLVLLVATGVLQGMLVAAGLNPIITTLAAGAIIFGVVSAATGGGIVRSGSGALDWGTMAILGVPVPVIVFVVFTALVTVVMSKTVIGRETILVGANRRTAEISGISTIRVTLTAFAIFSVGLAIAGILNGAAFGEATAQSFPDLSIDVIAALLVGGTAIQGGRGSPLRSALGAVLISVVSNIMVLNDFSTGGRRLFEGAVVVAVVVVLDFLRRRQAGRS